jgi:hypothetical protein
VWPCDGFVVDNKPQSKKWYGERKEEKKMKMNDSEREKMKEHLRAIAEIIYQHTPSDKLKTFEEIETTLREEIQKEITPEIAQFFFQESAKLKQEELEK